jgi:hypothetical protein
MPVLDMLTLIFCAGVCADAKFTDNSVDKT